MFTILSYTFPLSYLLEEVSIPILFLNCYFHFVELKSSMYILKQSPLSDFPDGLPWWLSGKASVYNAVDPGSILGWEDPLEKGYHFWQPTPVLLLGKSHGLKSLVGYSPQGCKESDMTERLHFLSFTLSDMWICDNFSQAVAWALLLI